MRKPGIELLSVFQMPRVEFVHVAADLGCQGISTHLRPFDVDALGLSFDINPYGYPTFDLEKDLRLRRQMKAAMADRGVRIELAEGLFVAPGVEQADRTGELDAFADLGAARINLVSFEPDWERTLDQFAVTMQLASERGMEGVIEFGTGQTVRNLSAALQAIRYLARPDVRLTVDTMHLFRSGSTVADLQAIDPDLIGYVQLSDVPMISAFDSYLQEAITQRMVPGEGELPLREVLALAPAGRVVSLEVPMIDRVRAGLDAHDRLTPAVDAARALSEPLSLDAS